MASTYSTWDFYKNTYDGQLTQEQHNRNAIKAMAQIDLLTMQRAADARDSMAERLALCECELVDAMQSFANRYELLPKGIASVNTDGLAISAASTQETDRERQEYSHICMKYLTRPFNLMYRGMRCGNSRSRAEYYHLL